MGQREYQRGPDTWHGQYHGDSRWVTGTGLLRIGNRGGSRYSGRGVSGRQGTESNGTSLSYSVTALLPSQDLMRGGPGSSVGLSENLASACEGGT